MGLTDSPAWQRLNGDSESVINRGWATDSSAFVSHWIRWTDPQESEYQIRRPDGQITQVLGDKINNTGQRVEWTRDSLTYLVAKDYQGSLVNTLNQYDEVTSTYQQISSPGVRVYQFEHSPDGSTLVRVDRAPSGSPARLGFSDTDNPTNIRYPLPPQEFWTLGLMGWSPDSSTLAILHKEVGSTGGFELSIVTGQTDFTHIFTGPHEQAAVVGTFWSPDSRYLAFLARDNDFDSLQSLYLYDTQAPSSLVQVPSPTADGNFLAAVWTSDSNGLYAALEDHITGERLTLEIPLAMPASPMVIADSLRVAYPPLTAPPDSPGVLWVQTDTANQTESLLYAEPGQAFRSLLTAGAIYQVLHSYEDNLGAPAMAFSR